MVPRLLLLHLVEHGRRLRVALAQSVGELAVDAAVFFLERDGEREDLALREIPEVLGHA